MPIYKITEKRIKKRAQDDADGTTELKAQLREMGAESESEGEQWSDESDSSSGGEDEEEDEEDDEEDDDEGEDEDEDDEEGLSDEDSELGSESDSDGESSTQGKKRKRAFSIDSSDSERTSFHLTPAEALESPIYTPDIDLLPDVQLCVLCPGKELRNAHMAKVHLESNAHKRGHKRFAQHLAARPPPEGTDPRHLAAALLSALAPVSVPAPSSSKSAKPGKDGEASGSEKKAKRGETRKARRDERMEKRVEAAIASGAAIKPATDGEGEAPKGLNRRERRVLEAMKKEGAKLSVEVLKKCVAGESAKGKGQGREGEEKRVSGKKAESKEKANKAAGKSKKQKTA